MKAAIIIGNSVHNVIMWDDTCTAPAGATAIAVKDDFAVAPGWGYVNGQFIPPPAPPAPKPPPVLTTEQKLEAAGLTVAELRLLFGLPDPEA